MENVAVRENRFLGSPLLLQVGLGILAIFSAIVYTTRGVTYPITGGGETIALTNNLVRDGSFANPFDAGKTGPSAFLPPLYPMFRAGLVKLFGNSGLVLSLYFTLLMHGLHAALLPSVSRLLLGSRIPGYWGAALAIVFPVFDVLHWEAMYVAAGLLAFILLTARLLTPDAPGTVWRGAAAGVGAGLLLLTNPASLFAFGPWLAVLLWRSRQSDGVWRTAAGLLLATVLCLLPWTIRNYRTFGRFVFVRDNLGLVLYASNNDCAAPRAVDNMRNGCNDLYNPIISKSEVQDVQRMGEVAYTTDRMQRAFNWMKREPRRFIVLTLQRFVDFWFPREAYSYWLITLLAIPGAFWIAGRRLWTGWVMLSILVLYPLVFYLAEMAPRYRYPIMWVTLLQAGYFFTVLPSRFRAPSVKAQSTSAAS